MQFETFCLDPERGGPPTEAVLARLNANGLPSIALWLNVHLVARHLQQSPTGNAWFG